ncbi:MAG: IS200/IS605 family transposase [Isosphaeraceae bacterium]
MSDSFACLYHHLIFSTKNRAPLLAIESQPRLFAFIGGILRSDGGILLAAGGMPDHVHLLVGIDRQASIAGTVRLVKSNSSRWIHETFPEQAGFAWQAGYGAFSVSASHLDRVEAYLARQAEHHRTISFQDEFRAFLDRHEISYDERFLWD